MTLRLACQVKQDEQHTEDVEAILTYNNLVFSAADDGKVKIWNENLELKKELQAHDYAVYDLLILGDTLYTCSVDSTIRSFDLNSLQHKQTFEGHEEPVRKLVTDGTFLYAGDESGEVKKWSPSDGHLIVSYSLIEEIWGLQVQDRFIYSIRDRDLVVTEMAESSEKLTVKFAIPGRAPFCLSSDYLTFADRNGITVRVHGSKSQSYEMKGELHGHEKIVNAMHLLSSDTICTGGWDATVKVWNLPKLSLEASCQVPDCVNAISSSEGDLYVGGSDGFIVKLKMENE